jgi:hypothetical protein
MVIAGRVTPGFWRRGRGKDGTFFFSELVIPVLQAAME